MKTWLVVSVALLLGLSGCCGVDANPLGAPANPCDTPPAAAAPDCRPVYTPVCSSGERPVSGEPADLLNAPADLALKSALGCNTPPAAEACPGGVCTPPPPAAEAPTEPLCGPLPADAKTGEVWCCVEVRPRSVGFERVVLEPARVEWRRITCPLEPGASEQECFVLVEIPEKIEMRPLAAPPPFHEWRRNAACEIPPAGAAPVPPPQGACR